MRKLIVLIVVLFSLWGGYWFIGSSAVQRGMISWLSQQQNSPLVIDYSTLKTRGFPNRFDTTIKDLNITLSDQGMRWETPFFQIFALSYKPNHIIAFLPSGQTITLRNQDIAISNSDMKASVIFKPNTNLALDRTSFVIKDLGLESNAGWSIHLSDAQLATRLAGIQGKSHDVALSLNNLRPSANILTLVDPNRTLPQVLESVQVNMRVDLNQPIDRFAAEGPPPQVIGINIQETKLVWGNLTFQATGDIRIGASGIPEGRIQLRVENWRTIFSLVKAAHIIPENMIKTVERGLEVLAGMSDNPETLNTPLIFHNGQMSFGPVPLGPAPRLIQ